MGSQVVAIIPARYESTRLPGKPLALIDGKPMIQHVFERTRNVALVDRVLVATDDARIAGGAPAPDADVIVNVQGDLPFLEAAMVDAAVALMHADAALPMATLKT